MYNSTINISYKHRDISFTELLQKTCFFNYRGFDLGGDLVGQLMYGYSWANATGLKGGSYNLTCRKILKINMLL